jgi:hypothetical protein
MLWFALSNRFYNRLITRFFSRFIGRTIVMQTNKTSAKTIGDRVFVLLETGPFFTHAEIVKNFTQDKAIISGYLRAMVDYKKISMKKVGKGKVYFLNEKGK